MPTIFDKIIAGEIPSHRVYEDDRVFAFLDINPIAEGHTLVVPKESVPTIDKLSDDSAAAIGRALPKIARAVCHATGATDFNILQNNGRAAHQEVPHVHFHIIPRFPDHAYAGLGITWKPSALEQQQGIALAERIRVHLTIPD